jgi:NAD(P)-dependent dehydrogenase (short-subunit alcohol dehydrogenase family)
MTSANPSDESPSRTVVVAGGTGTLGAPIARMIASRGYTTVTISRRRRGLAGTDAIHHFACDITDSAGLAQCFREMALALPPLSAVVNCAGCNRIRALGGYSEKELHRILDVNVFGAILVSRVAVPYLRRSGGGKIIYVASQAGLDPQPFNAVYSAAKAGVIALTKALARELAPDRISTIAVCPGDIESPMMGRAVRDFARAARVKPAMAERRIVDSIPLGRMATAAEIAEVVTQLLAVETTFLTGASVVAAGGRTCH